MLGVGIVIGVVVFAIGLILVGLSGSRRRARIWMGPAGTALATIGLVVQVTAVMGH
jgi:hypothetical protein